MKFFTVTIKSPGVAIQFLATKERIDRILKHLMPEINESEAEWNIQIKKEAEKKLITSLISTDQPTSKVEISAHTPASVHLSPGK